MSAGGEQIFIQYTKLETNYWHSQLKDEGVRPKRKIVSNESTRMAEPMHAGEMGAGHTAVISIIYHDDDVSAIKRKSNQHLLVTCGFR